MILTDLGLPMPVFGGKSRAAGLVWERFGVVVNYCEPFCRSAAILFKCPKDRRPRVETINDIDAHITNLLRAIRLDPEAVAREADRQVNEIEMHAWHKHLLAKIPELRERLIADVEHFDAELAGAYIHGASAWIGSGWCEEGMREPSRRMPALKGNGGTEKRGSGRPGYGDGVHGAAMREPSRKLPDVGGTVDGRTGKNNINRGKGVHSPEKRTHLHDLFAALSERLRYVRVTCGDWSRICTPAVTYRHGLTGIFLDPPYEGFEHVYGGKAKANSGRTHWPIADVLAFDEATEEQRAEMIKARGYPPPTAARVRVWCAEMGARKDMRIAICGYEGEHDELEALGWERVAWSAQGGYGNQREDGENENARRERIWFSKACLKPGQDVGQIMIPGCA